MRMSPRLSLCAAAPLAAVLAPAIAAQGTPFRVADLNTAPAASYDYGNLRAGRLVGAFSVFLADEGDETRVWRTDGTSAGTTLLLRIPGAHPAADTVEVVGGNGRAWFVGPDTGSGTVLWTSDGTPAGTVAIGNGGTAPMGLAFDAAADRCWFSATDATNGRELWRSDGTAATTVRVTQLRAGSLDGMLAERNQIAPLPSGVYFAGQNSTSGVELFRTSGLTVSLFANIATGTASSIPRDFCWNGDWLMFTALGANGVEPYCVAQGTLQALDVNPGVPASSPSGYVAYQTGFTQPVFWFVAQQVSSGSTVTRLFRYNPFSQSISVQDTVPVLSRVLFAVGSQVIYLQQASLTSWLYGIPGAGGTPIQLPANVSSPILTADNVSRISASPPRMVYTARSSLGGPSARFRGDGTFAGTSFVDNQSSGRVVTEFPGGLGALLADGHAIYTTGAPVPLVPTGVNAGSNPDRLAAMDGNVVVFCADGLPWRSDGTAAGTQPLYGPGAQQVGPFSPRFLGHRFFVAAAGGAIVYRTDGTPAGTVALPGLLSPGTTVAWAQTPTRLLLFSGNNLYAIDGLNTPELLRTGLPTQPAPASLGNLVLFRGQDPATGVELWRTDGTAPGTFLVRDTRPGAASGLGTGNELDWQLRARPGQLLFVVDDGLGDEVWRTDGTTAGTALVTDIAPGPASALISLGPTTADGRVLFAATSPTTGRDLWSTDGTNTQLLVDDVLGNRVQVLGPIGSQWLFTIGASTLGSSDTSRLYRTGGTTATTSLQNNLVFGAVTSGAIVNSYNSLLGIALFAAGTRIYRADTSGFNTFPIGQPPTLTNGSQWYTLPGADVAVFAGTSSGFGFEPWRSNGFPSGTTRVLDLNPGSASSLPREFTHAGGLVYFTADDGSSGRELWAMPTFPAVFAYGTGCPGTGGLVPKIVADDAPRLGAVVDFELQDGLPGSIALLALGLTGLQIPLGGGCSMLNDALVVTSVPTSPIGTTSLPQALPSTPSLVGVSLFAQYAVLDPNGAFAGLVSLSSGLQALVGI
jgi:ELWxxDGT repeat protein